MTTTATNRETGSMVSVTHGCVKQETLDLGIGTVLTVDDEPTYGSVWKHHTLFGFTLPFPFGRKIVDTKHPHDEIRTGKMTWEINYWEQSE